MPKHRPILLSQQDIDRFLAKIGPLEPNGCRLWTSTIGAGGYGEFRIKNKKTYAHRVVWAIEYEDPGDQHVLHRCDTPLCCNIDCLFLGSQADNLADMRNKGRQRESQPQIGAKNGRAKLSESDIRTIRDRYKSGEYQYVIAADYGVWQSTIGKIVTGKAWKHLTDDQ